ncbi:MAG: D-lyxose/D-mannose family sugar isomerase [Planctomycetota bacterium]
MAELERRNYQLRGQARAEALKRFGKAIARWRLDMPAVKPQVLDFGLGRFYQTGLIEFWIANEAKEKYCGKFLFVFGRQSCPYHRHKFKHETFFVLKGRVKMKVSNAEIIKSQGDMIAMRQNTNHSFTGIGDALLLEVSKPCKPNDNIFADKRIGENGIL